MAQPWGVSAMETTNEPHHTHGSAIHRVGESLKNALTPESGAETAKRNEALEKEHSVSQAKRNEAFEPEHHVGGTNLTVEGGTHHEARR
ncbi:hypothetical protein SVAN01_00487 [Stagonosporopsis vannaccii]|nr:hypothetical protein SVAN01_00487 [Stagonosporopsis vannaccii]